VSRAPAGATVVGPRARNRAVLARQLLLERVDLSIEAALEQVAGLQTQYSPSGYVGLWSRLAGFRRDDLTRALDERRVVQGSLMRGTIHLVSARDYWPFAIGLRRGRREAVTRMAAMPRADELRARSEALREALADGPRSVVELGGLGAGFIGNLGLWVELLRVPPSGTWERRRADRLALADAWLGPSGLSEEEGLTTLVRSYLRGFGPAPLRDVGAWAGLPVADIARGAANLELLRFADEAGHELVDLPEGLRPDPDTPAPVRFLAPFDTTFFAHSSRAGILPEEHRRRILNIHNAMSLGAVAVDGRIVAGWSVRAGQVVVERFEALAPADDDALEAERAALEAFHA
jgi:Winged helix DNA-binding domain